MYVRLLVRKIAAAPYHVSISSRLHCVLFSGMEPATNAYEAAVEILEEFPVIDG